MIAGVVLIAGAILLAACRSDVSVDASTAPSIKVVVENHTRERATLVLHTSSDDGWGKLELYVPACEASWGSSPLSPRWDVMLDGAELIDDSTEIPPVSSGESVVISIVLDADGPRVAEITTAQQGVTETSERDLCA